ncbi:MAG: hypothetical protein KDD70_09440 [Bdellovibrionales bacterium]|nr:hypothetical protein [Bdellovibrionales bacterium]
MGVKIVKGIAGQYEALKSPSNQANQSKNVSSQAVRAGHAVSAVSDAAVSLVRGGGRPESAERLTLDKAQKLAKGVADDVLNDHELALDAIGHAPSLSAVRDAFGV